MGTDEGISEGAAEGAFDVAASVGADEGIAEGAAEGGLEVAASVGADEGISDGAADGALDVDASVGAEDGIADGMEEGASEELSEDLELKLLQKLVKQRKDSAAIFNEQGREDLAAPELAEAAVIEQFLPAQLSEEEVAKVVDAIIAETGASSMKDMGRVMGMANQKLAGQADGKTISTIVKSRLS